MRLAFADLYAHIADPAHMEGHAAQLLAPAYLQRRAALIDPQRAGSYPPGQPSSGGTVYLCAADAQGRMVSFIQSNFKGFGSGVVVPGTGIALHNRGMGFVTPGHPNQVAGGKRPMQHHPGLHAAQRPAPYGVWRDGRQYAGPGPSADDFARGGGGAQPQACSDAPRWRINDVGALTLEHTVPAAVVEGLRAGPCARDCAA
jgi:gamma-glutamyltranspeptidase/glutathione hydrolase